MQVLRNDTHLRHTGDHFGQARHTIEGRRTARKSDYVEGWWENVMSYPVFVKDKYELKRICEAEGRRQGRVIIPRIFAKTKSQGRGIEWTF